MPTKNNAFADHIYINREFSNDYVKHQINIKLKAEKKKPMITLSEIHKRRRVAYLIFLLNAGTNDPGTAVTFDAETLLPIDLGKLRVGQPRVHWFKNTLKDLWQITKQNIDIVKFASDFDPNQPAHVAAIKAYAKQRAKKDAS